MRRAFELPLGSLCPQLSQRSISMIALQVPDTQIIVPSHEETRVTLCVYIATLRYLTLPYSQILASTTLHD